MRTVFLFGAPRWNHVGQRIVFHLPSRRAGAPADDAAAAPETILSDPAGRPGRLRPTAR
ncbi:hypothetical protein GCM10009543_15070 [Leifsonia naganoensis]